MRPAVTVDPAEEAEEAPPDREGREEALPGIRRVRVPGRAGRDWDLWGEHPQDPARVP